MGHGFRAIQSAKILYFFAIASLIAQLRVQVFNNTVPFDYINGLFIIYFLLYLLMSRNLKIHLLVPLLIIFLGSAISMFNTKALAVNMETLIQDMYLFMFFLIVCNIIENKYDLGIVMLFWVLFAALQGGLALGEFAGNFKARATGTFLNPNMAGNYLGMSLFFLFQPYVKFGRILTAFLTMLILGGMLATKSLSVTVGFSAGVLVIIILYWRRVRVAKRVKLSLAVLTVVIVGIIFYPELEGIPNLLSRAPESIRERVTLWETGLHVFAGNPLGSTIGPGGFRIAGPKVAGIFQRKSELHSDWLSFLVERGAIGFIGLVVLFGAIAKMLFQSLKAVQSDREFLWVIGLYGMFIFILTDALFHEVLHYRHVWFAFAVIVAQYSLRRRVCRE